MSRRLLGCVAICTIVAVAGCSTAVAGSTSAPPSTPGGSSTAPAGSDAASAPPSVVVNATNSAGTPSTPASGPSTVEGSAPGSTAAGAGSVAPTSVTPTAVTPTTGTAGSTGAAPTAPATAASQSMTDLRAISWAAISLPVSVLRPALAPTKTAQGDVGTLCTDSTLDWQRVEPTGWVAFSKSQALIPDPTETPSTYNPHPGWAMVLGQPVFGRLSDGTAVAVLELTCAPTGANAYNTMILVFDGVGGQSGKPNLIGMYQPPGQLKQHALSVVDGHIAVTWSILEPNDPRSSPSGTGTGQIDLQAGRLVPSWPDNGGLRALLWSTTIGSSGSAATGTAPASTAGGPALDLNAANLKSFSLPLDPLVAALTQQDCLRNSDQWRKDFPSGRVPFAYGPPISGVTTTGSVQAFIPDRSITLAPGQPGKAGWLLQLSAPAFGHLSGGGPAVAVFSMRCSVATPADGAPVVLLVLDGAGGSPNPLGIYAAGQYSSSIAVTNGAITAQVGNNSPWSGTLTVRYQGGRLVPALQPAGGWTTVQLWSRGS